MGRATSVAAEVGWVWRRARGRPTRQVSSKSYATGRSQSQPESSLPRPRASWPPPPRLDRQSSNAHSAPRDEAGQDAGAQLAYDPEHGRRDIERVLEDEDERLGEH